jgi:hypothetical protein
VEAAEEDEGGTKPSMRRSENTRPCAPKSWAVMTPRPLLRLPLPHQRKPRSTDQLVTRRSPLHRMGRVASGAAEVAVAAHPPAAAVWPPVRLAE